MNKRMVLLLSCCAIALGVGCTGASYSIYSNMNNHSASSTISSTQTENNVTDNNSNDSTSNIAKSNEVNSTVKNQTENNSNEGVSNKVPSNKSTISNTTTLSKASTVKATTSNNSNSVKSNSTNTSSNSAKSSATLSVNEYEYIMNFCSDVAILKGPSDNSGVLLTVPGQTQVYVYSQSAEWAYVQCQGVKGYIPTSELRFIPYAAKNGYGINRTGYILGSFKGNAYIMSGMSENSNIVYSLKEGDSFYVLSECGSWYFVEAGNYSGFIPMSDVVFLNPAIPINKAHC